MTLDTLLEPFEFLRKYANIFDCKSLSSVSTTPAINKKVFDIFPLFCLEPIGYTLTVYKEFFQNVSVQGVG
jgi:hypothetical protein